MRIVTWNMQGANHSTENKWNQCVLPMLKETDAVCLQEAGAPPASAQPWIPGFNVPPGISLATWGTERNHRYITYYYAGQRVSMAVVSNTAPTDVLLVAPTTRPANRPALGATIAGLTVFSWHAISPGGPDTPGLLTAVRAAMPATSRWVVAADFNREPPVDGFYCQAPNAPTYSVLDPRWKLDWCVTSWNARTTGMVQATHFSDHYPVLYDL